MILQGKFHQKRVSNGNRNEFFTGSSTSKKIKKEFNQMKAEGMKLKQRKNVSRNERPFIHLRAFSYGKGEEGGGFHLRRKDFDQGSLAEYLPLK